jgi:acetyl-CoA carboxylase biotin carboxylase subunit
MEHVNREVSREMFTKVLVANRGEIAIRVLRALKEMKIDSVAVFSDADRTSPHVRYADQAYRIGPAPSAESYLNIAKIIEVAKKSGSQAIHPGYGFLAENAAFAKACEQEKIVFVGPSSRAIALLGDKTKARAAMKKAEIPIIPGSQDPVEDPAQARSVCEEIGYPVILKAAAGGGGKGMRRIATSDELTGALNTAMAEASSAFDDSRIYVEKFIENPRHIEFQILADSHGNVVHLGERECSVQRRHQKMIEESPSCAVDQSLRKRMGDVACRVVTAAGYTNAGTVEFLLDRERNFYFLEMNTRLQVEHPVTELVTGIDIVKQQFLIAAGAELALTQDDISMRGSAIECRISAEDTFNDFMPSTGRITRLIEPGGPGIRLESGVFEGLEISLYYDPLIAKLLAWGETREEAISRMKRALREYWIHGIKTTIPFHMKILQTDRFLSGDYDTGIVPSVTHELCLEEVDSSVAAIAAAIMTHRRREARLPKMKLLSQQNPWKMSGRMQGLRKSR